MASTADIKKKLGDIKARPLILIVGGILLVGLILIIFGVRRGSTSTAEGNLASKTAPVPNIRSTPGVGETQDQTYNQLQLEQNRIRAQQAEQQGGSSVPTLINQPGSIASLNANNTDQAALQYQKLLEEQNRRNAERNAATTKNTSGLEQQQAAAQQAFEGLMQKQVNDLMKRWQPVSEAVVGGQILEKDSALYAQMQTVKGTNADGSTTGTASKGPALFKAGDIVFGVLQTGINTDEPGPIMVEIVSGALKGAKLIGSVQRQKDKVMLSFNLLNSPSLPSSVPVNVVAIDPETARTALASDVNNHYLLTYGAVFAGAFLQGVSQAVQSSLQPSFTSSNNTFVATSTKATTTQEILVGLGQVGQQMSQQIQQYKPDPTVTVDSGTSVGLLFLSDFTPSTALEDTQNKPVYLEQTLSTLPAGTSTSSVSANNSGGLNQPIRQSMTTTTQSTGPLPGTIGPRNQSQQTTVTTTQPGH
jgi:intracellular multiplication protein IcmE